MKKILHFEDFEPFRIMYEIEIVKAGFSYNGYCNPPADKNELVALVLKEKPNLIIMDIIMPEIDGYCATKILKANSETKDIPIFGISNMEGKKITEDAINCGMIDYFVTSHLIPSEFVGCIENFLNNPEKYLPQYKKNYYNNENEAEEQSSDDKKDK